MRFMHRYRRSVSMCVLTALAVAMTAPPAAAEYNPKLGRFMQADPNGQALVLQALRHSATNPMVTVSMAYQLQYGDGMNFYEYLRSSPIARRDPGGTRSYVEIMASVGIQTALGGMVNGMMARMAGRDFWQGFAEGAIGGAFGGAAGFAFQAARAGFFGSAVLGRFVEGAVEEGATQFYNGTDVKDALVDAFWGGAMNVATGGLLPMNKRNVDAIETLGAAQGASRFTRKNSIRPRVGPGSYRDELAEVWGKAAPPGYHAHHVFPLDLADDFRRLGVEPDNVIFGSWWEATDHLHNVKAYRETWETFLEGNPAPGQILQMGRDLAGEYGLSIMF